MGTWGPGNFNSDDARDYLDTIIEPLFALVWDFFARKIDDKELSDEDEGWFTSVQSRNLDYGECKVLPTIDVLITFTEQYNTILFLKPETAESWKQIYLQLYDQKIDDWGPKPDYKIKRRQVIEATFDKLIQIATATDQKVGIREPLRVKVTAAEGLNVEFESAFGNGQGIWEGDDVQVGKVYFVELDFPGELKWGDAVTPISEDAGPINAFSIWGKVIGIWQNDIGVEVENTFIRLTVPSNAAKIGDWLRVKPTNLILRDSKL